MKFTKGNIPDPPPPLPSRPVLLCHDAALSALPLPLCHRCHAHTCPNATGTVNSAEGWSQMQAYAEYFLNRDVLVPGASPCQGYPVPVQDGHQGHHITIGVYPQTDRLEALGLHANAENIRSVLPGRLLSHDSRLVRKANDPFKQHGMDWCMMDEGNTSMGATTLLGVTRLKQPHTAGWYHAPVCPWFPAA